MAQVLLAAGANKDVQDKVRERRGGSWWVLGSHTGVCLLVPGSRADEFWGDRASLQMDGNTGGRSPNVFLKLALLNQGFSAMCCQSNGRKGRSSGS